MGWEMKLSLKNVILATISLFILYYLLKFLLFIIESVFEGIVAIFTSGFIYLIVVGFLVFKYRRKIKSLLGSLKLEPLLIRKDNKDVKCANKQDHGGTIPFNKLQDSKQTFSHREEAAATAKKDPVEEKTALKEERSNLKNEKVRKVEATLQKVGESIKQENDFITFVKGTTPEEVKKLVNKTYTEFSTKYKNEVGFGESGSIEFVGSLLLMNYDNSTKRDIEKGIESVFKNMWSPLDFSDYMDDVVKKSKVPYSMWSEGYRYLQNHHIWIEKHDCAKEANRVNKDVENLAENLLTLDYTSDGMLDFIDASEKNNYICLNFINEKDYFLGKSALEPLFIQMVRNFRLEYKNGSFIDNQYWYHYFEVLSDIMMNLSVCEVNLGNIDSCINHASLSVKISANLNTTKLEKAGELILYALTHNGDALSVHPQETLKQQIPPNLINKAELLYETIIIG
ncbi:hypothetical protein JCM9140_4752 [Halalkalibacter wakoensis JCM 9140]|uniref:Uncharacterized protein n=1 Tax=Halalkalibacter wakoensis JCM 9140 TaxID=1236970 RepID=W4QA24_9BACI|nr:hypothetical protein [Halalkalibacter wakoensis]GAE28508.1 hypothetical protein JCM9140_4752 [Halalkalibacter wakoensis JCM 9140]